MRQHPAPAADLGKGAGVNEMPVVDGVLEQVCIGGEEGSWESLKSMERYRRSI